MKIDNNYAQRQPNFGRLKSIQYCKNFNPDTHPKEIAELLCTIDESKAFKKFFKKYDVDMSFDSDVFLSKTKYINMKLKTTLPEAKYKNLYPDINFWGDNWNYRNMYDELIGHIENASFSYLESRLENSLNELIAQPNMNKIYSAKIDKLTDSLLTQNLPDTPKKKTFFEKLFDWLK